MVDKKPCTGAMLWDTGLSRTRLGEIETNWLQLMHNKASYNALKLTSSYGQDHNLIETSQP